MLSPSPSSHMDRWQIIRAPPPSAQSTGAVRRAACCLICLLPLHLEEASEFSNGANLTAMLQKNVGVSDAGCLRAARKEKSISGPTQAVLISAQLNIWILRWRPPRQAVYFCLLHWRESESELGGGSGGSGLLSQKVLTMETDRMWRRMLFPPYFSPLMVMVGGGGLLADPLETHAQRLCDRDGRDRQRREKRVDDSQPHNCCSHRFLPGVWNFRGQK